MTGSGMFLYCSDFLPLWPDQSGGWWLVQRSGSLWPRCPPPHERHRGTGASCGWRMGWQSGQNCACGWAPVGKLVLAPDDDRSCPPQTVETPHRRVHEQQRKAAIFPKGLFHRLCRGTFSLKFGFSAIIFFINGASSNWQFQEHSVDIRVKRCLWATHCIK